MYQVTINIDKLLNQSNFSKKEIIYLLNLTDKSQKNLLLKKSNQLEKKYPLSSINSYGLIEISTHCKENCIYCRFRRDNNNITRNRMNRENIIDIAKEINKSGIKSIVIRSGYDDFYDQDRIAYIIYSIKKYTDVEIMLSLGERTYEEYKEWKIAGASGYRLRFKSSNHKIYDSLNVHGSFEDRLVHIEHLKILGYKICSGSILGLPQQTKEDIANDIYLCQNLNLSMAEFLTVSPQIHTPKQKVQKYCKEEIDFIHTVAKVVLKDIVRYCRPKYLYSIEKHLIN